MQYKKYLKSIRFTKSKVDEENIVNEKNKIF